MEIENYRNSPASIADVKKALSGAEEVNVSVNGADYEVLEDQTGKWDIMAAYQAEPDSIEMREDNLNGYRQLTFSLKTGSGDQYRLKTLL
jgi:hypothetical protein